MKISTFWLFWCNFRQLQQQLGLCKFRALAAMWSRKTADVEAISYDQGCFSLHIPMEVFRCKSSKLQFKNACFEHNFYQPLFSCCFLLAASQILIMSQADLIWKTLIFEWQNWPKGQFCQIAKCYFCVT